MPITVEIDPDTLRPTLAISPRPDHRADDLAVWSMDQAVLEAYPEMATVLIDAGFSYVGTITNSDKKKGTTLHYSRPETPPGEPTPVEKAATTRTETAAVVESVTTRDNHPGHVLAVSALGGGQRAAVSYGLTV
jgi:hypothetical protein